MDQNVRVAHLQNKVGTNDFSFFFLDEIPHEKCSESFPEILEPLFFGGSEKISEAQSWRKRNMTHQCSHEREPASAHASVHASVHESAHKSWLSLCYNPIQRLPLECSRECSRGCPRKCTQSGLVICHLVCFHLLYSLPKKSRNISRKISFQKYRKESPTSFCRSAG